MASKKNLWDGKNKAKVEAALKRAAALEDYVNIGEDKHLKALAAEVLRLRELIDNSIPTITCSPSGAVVAVTLQNKEHQIQKILWEAPAKNAA